ncbi:MAG: hypothetical protein H6840_02855 [Planctomycetes bacterium]|nr:hypothetical protein [Planctomycetota bacterium]
MADEAWAALDDVRARLELKYKQAEYRLERTWTVESLMRRLDRLDGKYFHGTDFTLSFPEGEEPVVEVACVSMDGAKLPDGELRMNVNLRTGRTTKSGCILARNTDGLVLLGERETKTLSDWMLHAVYAHLEAQTARTEDGLAPLEDLFEKGSPTPFLPDDFRATQVVERPMAIELTCSTLQGKQLAEPAVIVLDYAARRAKISGPKSAAWIPIPESREDFKERCLWLTRLLTRTARMNLDAGMQRQEVLDRFVVPTGWALRWAGILPFDIKMEISEESPWIITVEIVSSFSRPLPYPAPTYVSRQAKGQEGWEDGD